MLPLLIQWKGLPQDFLAVTDNGPAKDLLLPCKRSPQTSNSTMDFPQMTRLGLMLSTQLEFSRWRRVRVSRAMYWYVLYSSSTFRCTQDYRSPKLGLQTSPSVKAL